VRFKAETGVTRAKRADHNINLHTADDLLCRSGSGTTPDPVVRSMLRTPAPLLLQRSRVLAADPAAGAASTALHRAREETNAGRGYARPRVRGLSGTGGSGSGSYRYVCHGQKGAHTHKWYRLSICEHC
jgi:hypothetical protein